VRTHVHMHACTCSFAYTCATTHTACAPAVQGQANGFVPAPKPKPSTTSAVLLANQNSTAPADPTSAPLAKRLKDVLDALLQSVGEQLTPEDVVARVCVDVCGWEKGGGEDGLIVRIMPSTWEHKWEAGTSEGGSAHV